MRRRLEPAPTVKPIVPWFLPLMDGGEEIRSRESNLSGGAHEAKVCAPWSASRKFGYV